MNYFSKIFLACVASVFFLEGCTTYVTQEMKPEASFAGLTKAYVEPAQGGEEVFSRYGMKNSIKEEVAVQTRAWLKEHNYEVVDDKSQAQLVFVPLWNVSYESGDEWLYRGNVDSSTSALPIGDTVTRPYAILEMQVKYPTSDDWMWRGFSPIKATGDMFTSSVVREQVNWCLQHFPPEKNPPTVSSFWGQQRKWAEDLVDDEASSDVHAKSEATKSDATNAKEAAPKN